jgi:hypothetical protein
VLGLLLVVRLVPATVRTSAPALPSGRRAASTSQAASRQIRMSAAATRVALVRAELSESLGSTGSATKTTSTSLT